MPVVQMTVLEGYDDVTKSRLLKGMTHVVLSVMAAKPDGIVTMLNEVSPSAYARGGVSRVPGPPLPTGVSVVQQFVAAVSSDPQQARQYLQEDCTCTDSQGTNQDPLAMMGGLTKLAYAQFDEVFTEDGTIVYARRERGNGSVERFHVRHGRIADIQTWGATV
jgi:phenylpyruvate tautomerase PptA (4-oxalocrotonate tautomerase family)